MEKKVRIPVNLIVAACKNNGIGVKGDLPWSLRREMKHFSKITKTTKDSSKQNAVIMGRNTWNSIPSKFRPLPERLNILVSSNAVKDPASFPGCVAVKSFGDALQLVEDKTEEIETVWIIGGSSIYKAALDFPSIDKICMCVHRIYLTRILTDFECDTFLPAIDEEIYEKIEIPEIASEVQEEGSVQYVYEVYQKIAEKV